MLKVLFKQIGNYKRDAIFGSCRCNGEFLPAEYS